MEKNTDKNIKLTEIGKISIESLKARFGFKTYSDCLIEIDSFFSANNVSPKDKTISKLQTNFDDIKKFISNDSQSLRKRHGAIEKEYFIPISKKIDAIFNQIVVENRIDNSAKNSENILDDSINKENLAHIKNQERIINDLNILVKKRDEMIENRDTTISEYFKIVKTLNDNIKFEKTTFGNKVFINLPVEEINNLFKIIP